MTVGDKQSRPSQPPFGQLAQIIEQVIDLRVAQNLCFPVR